MIRDQFLLDIAPEIIIDNFAGGGGASCGIELALGRHVDIGMRMLEPHELYAAQGFPSTYVIAPIMANGKPLPKHAQVRMCGNSVSPPMAAALVRANVPDMTSWSARERRLGVAA
ncbi:DNA cytosine methyltransferase [Cupriavidus sp. RAF12]|uniref:DNA cytosine methyltransferase n=1 Tax=Cupriavidus sp. RAF12 TaxID=3233050 RepID=UPI003F932930